MRRSALKQVSSLNGMRAGLYDAQGALPCKKLSAVLPNYTPPLDQVIARWDAYLDSLAVTSDFLSRGVFQCAPHPYGYSNGRPLRLRQDASPLDC